MLSNTKETIKDLNAVAKDVRESARLRIKELQEEILQVKAHRDETLKHIKERIEALRQARLEAKAKAEVGKVERLAKAEARYNERLAKAVAIVKAHMEKVKAQEPRLITAA